MHQDSALIALIVLLAILAAVYHGYNKCALNKYLAAKHQKKPCSGGGTFVGAMAQHPGQVPLAFPTSPSWVMNRGTYA